ncbi:nucleotidyltransferase family protein, partial [Acidobacteriota bacterium]
HWLIDRRTGNTAKIDVNELWVRAKPFTTTNFNALALANEDLLLHLCYHTAQQHMYFGGLKAFCDIAETIHNTDVDLIWEQIVFRACKWNIRRSVYLTLLLVKEMLGAAIPSQVLQSLQTDDFSMDIIEWAKEMILAEDSSDTFEVTRDISRISGPSSIKEKIAYILKRIFLSRREMAARYPPSVSSPLMYLYYFVRIREAFILNFKPIVHIFRDKNKKEIVTRREKLSKWMEST